MNPDLAHHCKSPEIQIPRVSSGEDDEFEDLAADAIDASDMTQILPNRGRHLSKRFAC